MRERKETISIVKANYWAVALLFAGAIVSCLYYFIIRGAEGCKVDVQSGFEIGSAQWYGPLVGVLIFFVIMMAGAAFHELVHGCVWAHYAKQGWKSISFGVIFLFTRLLHVTLHTHKYAYVVVVRKTWCKKRKQWT